jgi:KUP system potassium uptake protein
LEVRRRLYAMSMPLDQFLDLCRRLVIGRAPGLGVWLTKVEHGASPMLLRHIEHNRVLHETVVLLSFVSDRGRACRFTNVIRSSVSATASIGCRCGSASCRRRIFRDPDQLQMLGFDADLDHKHYYIAHETVVRREKDSAMGPVSFAIFSFLNRISSRAPDYFKIPHDAVIEVGFRVEI